MTMQTNRPTPPRLRAPWRDRQGKFAWLRLAAFVAVLLPVGWIGANVYDAYAVVEFQHLPLGPIIYFSGIASIWLLLMALAITPLRYLTGYNRLIGIRRMLGLGGFAYAAVHVVDYFFLREWSGGFMVTELLSRVTIIVAIVATIGLIALAATSTDAAIKRMGVNWTRLHTVIYPAVALAILHFTMSPGSFSGDPFMMAGLYFLLMGWRLLQSRGLGTAAWPLVGLAVASAVAEIVYEFAALWLFKQMAPAEVIALNYNLDYVADIGLPTPLTVLLVGLAAAAVPTIAAAVRSRRAGAGAA